MKNKKTKFSVSKNTSLPITSHERQQKAELYLEMFSKFTNYKHRGINPYLNWLKTKPHLKDDAICRFFNFWYPVSRHQPQILWRIGAAYPDWIDRHYVMQNLREEDAHVNSGDDPHYDLLEELIIKLGGKLDIDPEAEELVNMFHKSLDGMTPAQATGYIAAIEHPALDISDYFTTITTLCGYPELLVEDLYLSIHIDVEPKHLIWSHGNALDWMEEEGKMKRLKYKKEDITDAFTHAMSFWDNFWSLAFSKLGYNQS